MNKLKIISPNYIENLLEIKNLIIKLADESDNFPFVSEDMNMSDETFGNFVDFLINSYNSTLVLAYQRDVLVGLGFLEGGKKSRTYHLANLGIGVLSEYQNKGIGNNIMDKLISYAKEGEYVAKIDILVRQNNKYAIELYKSKGFVLEGKNRRSLFIDGEFHDMLYMGLIVE